jgi:predicted ribosome quality control (RQC) complex YloA/Tae2 family protein
MSNPQPPLPDWLKPVYVKELLEKDMKEFYMDGIRILLGTTQQENHELLINNIDNPDWVWLHAKHVNSGHGIIQCISPNMTILKFAALQVKLGCKEKNNKYAKIEYTKLSNITIVGIGKVDVNSSKSLVV